MAINKTVSIELYEYTNNNGTIVESQYGDPITSGIEAGSISISEILFDGNLEFGVINSNKMELRLYSQADLKGKKIILKQTSTDDSTSPTTVTTETLFTGYVQSCKLSGYDYYRDIIAYDELYFKKDLNIANFYSGTVEHDIQTAYSYEGFFNDETTTKTLKGFREALCRDFLGFTLATAPNLPNDSMAVEKTINISSMKFSEMIKMICELQGTIPNMTRDGKLEFVALKGAFGANAVKTIYAFGNNNVLETENSTFEDYVVNKITQVILMGEDSEGNQQIAGFSTDNNVSDNNNILIFENNILILNKTADDTKGSVNNTNRIAQAIYADIKNITYAPCELTFIQSDVSIKIGDLLVVRRQPLDASGNSNIGRYVYCTSIELSGSQLVNETILCSGEESTSDSTSSSNASFEALADKAYPIQTSMSVDYFRAKYISTDYIQAQTANFGEVVINNLVAGTITTEELNAIRAKIDTLDANTITSTWLTATYASLQVLTANTITSDVISTKYLTADMANLGQVGMEEFFAKTGIVTNLTVVDGHVTGRLTGVAINANVIDTGTLAVDRLIIKGAPTGYVLTNSEPDRWEEAYFNYYTKTSNNDYVHVAGVIVDGVATAPTWQANTYYKASYGNNSIMYKLNSDGILATAHLTEEELNTQLDGKIIVAKSITATEIAAKTITANEIAARTITANEITANTITATEIATGTITADKIKAGSITTECLAVGDFTNYFIVNPANLDEFRWETSPSTFTEIGWITPMDNTTYYALTEPLQLQSGTRLQLFGYIYPYSGYTTGIGICWYNSENTLLEFGYASSGVSGESEIKYTTAGAKEFKNSNKNNLIKIPTYPQNATHFQICAYTTKTTMKKFHLRNFAIRRADGGDIIAGKIMSRDGNSYFDLDLGEIVTDHAEITGGTISIGSLDYGTTISDGSLYQYLIFNNIPNISGGLIPTGDSTNLYQTIYADTSTTVKGVDIAYKDSIGNFPSIATFYKNGYMKMSLNNVPYRSERYMYERLYSEPADWSTKYRTYYIENTYEGNTVIEQNLNATWNSRRIYYKKINPISGIIGFGNSSILSGNDLAASIFNYDSDMNQKVRLDISTCFDSNMSTLYDGVTIRGFCSDPRINRTGTTTTSCIHLLKDQVVIGSIELNTSNQFIYNRCKDLIAKDIYGSSINPSTEDIKTNISMASDVLSLFENSEIYSFNYTHEEPVVTLDGQEVFELDENDEPILDENGDPIPQMQTVADSDERYGFVIGSSYNTPAEVISADGRGVNLYSMASLTWKAVQELYERVKLLEGNSPQSV